MTKGFRIGAREVGPQSPPLVIAELSGNHAGSLEHALAIVDAVADAGAEALKLQTYKPETMTLDVDLPEFTVQAPDSPWAGRRLYDLYNEAQTPWEWHRPIFERARSRDMLAFSSPFDLTAIGLLEELDAPCHKIASFENGDVELIAAAASTGKPLIISTGLATLSEIETAVTAAREGGCKDLLLLKCTSDYPASPEDSNLATLAHLRDAFGCPVGVSDHTLGIGAALGGVALGAVAIEKHVTLSRADGGVDSQFSMEPDELRQLIDESTRAWQAVGRVAYGPTPRERSSLVFRRSLYVVEDVAAGERLTRANVRAIRPGHGDRPVNLPRYLGMTVVRDVSVGTPLTPDLLG